MGGLQGLLDDLGQVVLDRVQVHGVFQAGKLERKLGVTLFERTSRRVTLTPAGAVLLDQGRIAVEAAAAAVERARRTGTQPGRLTVAVKPGAGAPA